MLVKIKVLTEIFPKLINEQDGIRLCRMDFQKRIRFCCTIIQETRVLTWETIWLHTLTGCSLEITFVPKWCWSQELHPRSNEWFHLGYLVSYDMLEANDKIAQLIVIFLKPLHTFLNRWTVGIFYKQQPTALKETNWMRPDLCSE